MGWDVVQLGLKHDLPIDDPQATAQVLARRMGCDVRWGTISIVSTMKPNKESILSLLPLCLWLLRIEGGSSAPSLRLIIANYWVEDVRRRIALYDSSKIEFEEEWMKPCLLEGFDPFELYTL